MTTNQLALPGVVRDRKTLFDSADLKRYLSDVYRCPGPTDASKLIDSWINDVQAGSVSEANLESAFLQRILGEVLGYSLVPSDPASLYPKPLTKHSHCPGTPDAGLGRFNAAGDDYTFVGVLEIKAPGADLDRPQPSYKNKTAVEQAFEYAQNIPGASWILVTDMLVIRLYNVALPGCHHEFRLPSCASSPSSCEEFSKLLHRQQLVDGLADSSVSRLFRKSAESRASIHRSFYDIYYKIRATLFEAIEDAAGVLDRRYGRDELLGATQRLLDRLLFIYYCEDHPDHLIPDGTVKAVTSSAAKLPGSDPKRVYESLKALFREIDAGSSAASGLKLFGYNGELFKEHAILDQISLPDSLNGQVFAASPKAGPIVGVWGLHVYDFWKDLNEHALGHLFEESLSDLEHALADDHQAGAAKLTERKRHGIFYTTKTLADFVVGSALEPTLADLPTLPQAPSTADRDVRLSALLRLRVADLACGSGAFLVSGLAHLLREYWRTWSAVGGDGADEGAQLAFSGDRVEAEAVRRCVFGVDLSPQAVEIAKLAVWLRSAQANQKVADLSQQIVAADSLEVPKVFSRLGVEPGSFDVIVGNPPWGAAIGAQTREHVVRWLDLDPDRDWDTWELFLLTALEVLRPGGRLALLVPDSLLYEEKAETRRQVMARGAIEKLYNLGPDWFGPEVRMGTLMLQVRKGRPSQPAVIRALLLAGARRRAAICGEASLPQIEAQRSRTIPVARVEATADRRIEVFRGQRDDRIIGEMETNSIRLHDLCSHYRGEEMSKAGLLWRCPSCLGLCTPGRKRKGGGYLDTTCSTCGHRLAEASAQPVKLVHDGARPPSDTTVAFIDGDDLSHRYRAVRPTKWLLFEPDHWRYKPDELYVAPKILIRQAGVGVCAALDHTAARCPQSVYIYRLHEAFAAHGYKHEYVLGALLSRTMNYYVLKRFGEVDPAKAFAKLTHERIGDCPVPRVDFTDRRASAQHDRVVELVNQLLSADSPCGSPDDLQVELLLRNAWGIRPDDGAYINGEFYDLPHSQMVQDLFPMGAPAPAVQPDGFENDAPQAAAAQGG